MSHSLKKQLAFKLTFLGDVLASSFDAPESEEKNELVLEMDPWRYPAMIEYISRRLTTENLSKAHKERLTTLKKSLKRAEIASHVQMTLQPIGLAPGDYCFTSNHAFSLTESGQHRVEKFSKEKLLELNQFIKSSMMTIYGSSKLTKTYLKKLLQDTTKIETASVKQIPAQVVQPVMTADQKFLEVLSTIMRQITLTQGSKLPGDYQAYSVPVPDLSDALPTVFSNLVLLENALFLTKSTFCMPKKLQSQLLVKLDMVINGGEVFINVSQKTATNRICRSFAVLLGVLTQKYLESIKFNDELNTPKTPNYSYASLIFDLFKIHLDTCLTETKTQQLYNYQSLKKSLETAALIVESGVKGSRISHARNPIGENLCLKINLTSNWGLHHILYLNVPVDVFVAILNFEIYKFEGFNFTKDLFEIGMPNIKGDSPLVLMATQTPKDGTKGDYLKMFIDFLRTKQVDNRNTIPKLLHKNYKTDIADQVYCQFLGKLIHQTLPAELVAHMFKSQGFGLTEMMAAVSNPERKLDESMNSEKIMLERQRNSAELGVDFCVTLLANPSYLDEVLLTYLAKIDIDLFGECDIEGKTIEWHLLEMVSVNNSPEIESYVDNALVLLCDRLVLSDQSVAWIKLKAPFTGEALTYNMAYNQEHVYTDGTTTLLNAVTDKSSFTDWREARLKHRHYQQQLSKNPLEFDQLVGKYTTANFDNALHLYFRQLDLEAIRLDDIEFLLSTCEVDPVSENCNGVYPLECLLTNLLSLEDPKVVPLRIIWLLKLLGLKFPDQKFISLAFAKKNKANLKKILGQNFFRDYLSGLLT